MSDVRISPTVRLTDSPSAVVVGGKVYCFYQGFGASGDLYFSVFTVDTGSKSITTQDGPTVVGDVKLTGSPSAVAWNDDIYVFHRGQDGNLWYKKRFRNGNWAAGEAKVASGIALCPSAILFKDKIWVFYQGDPPAERIKYSTIDANGTIKNDYAQLPSAGLSESPTVAVHNGKLHVSYQGMGHCGQLWYSVSDENGENWGGSQNSGRTVMSSSPSAIDWSGAMYVFHRGKGEDNQVFASQIHESSLSLGGPVWTFKEAGNIFTKVTPGAMVYNDDCALVFHQADNNSQELYCFIIVPGFWGW